MREVLIIWDIFNGVISRQIHFVLISLSAPFVLFYVTWEFQLFSASCGKKRNEQLWICHDDDIWYVFMCCSWHRHFEVFKSLMRCSTWVTLSGKSRNPRQFQNARTFMLKAVPQLIRLLIEQLLIYLPFVVDEIHSQLINLPQIFLMSRTKGSTPVDRKGSDFNHTISTFQRVKHAFVADSNEQQINNFSPSNGWNSNLLVTCQMWKRTFRCLNSRLSF